VDDEGGAVVEGAIKADGDHTDPILRE